MNSHRQRLTCLAIVLLTAACRGPAGDGHALTQQQALEAAWIALEPNTSSHERANWEVVSVERVQGRDVAGDFEGGPAPGCFTGPTPAPNPPIDPAATYWHVAMQPVAATSLPVATEFYSPTAPPRIPEPFVREAQFLIDSTDGSLVAIRLGCVIY